MSRITARETTMPAPADIPCKARKKTSTPMCWASAQPIEASVNTARPTSTTGRRPKLSASAPWKRFMIAKPNRYAESVCCISTGVAPIARAIPVKAGK
jgi:hypothetical protein